MDEDTKQKVLARLRRAGGQIDGITRMVEDGRYCVDLLTQIAAAQAALGRAAEIVLEQHVESCVAEAFASGDDRERREKINELMGVFSRYSRSRR